MMGKTYNSQARGYLCLQLLWGGRRLASRKKGLGKEPTKIDARTYRIVVSIVNAVDGLDIRVFDDSARLGRSAAANDLNRKS
jgi:hypothetical protein